ncbi:hypothetical protein WA171_006118, partial [Blastocystis sp. BT1]
SPPESCSVSIPGGKDDVTSLLIQQPGFQALPCTVYTVDPDTVVYDSDFIPIERIETYLKHRHGYLLWCWITLVFSLIELFVTWVALVWICLYVFTIICLYSPVAQTCSMILGFISGIIHLGVGFVVSLVLLSLGTQGLILEIFVVPSLLVQIISFIVLVITWIHLCRVPHKYRQYTFLYKKALSTKK